jgi:hypothetical protein
MIKWGSLRRRIIAILLLAAGLGFQAFPQQAAAEDPFNVGPAPEIVRQPRQGEAPRYPRDMVIGELGRGTAPEDAWLLACGVLDALVRGIKSAPVLAAGGESLRERLFSELETTGPEKYRLGGGSVEADGSVSFLVRFLGRERSIAGELYLVRAAPEDEDGNVESAGGEDDGDAAAGGIDVNGGNTGEPALWRLDDLVLEEAADLAAEREAYQYDFSPYERFY